MPHQPVAFDSHAPDKSNVINMFQMNFRPNTLRKKNGDEGQSRLMDLMDDGRPKERSLCGIYDNYIKTMVVIYGTDPSVARTVAITTTAHTNRTPVDGDHDWHSNNAKKKSYDDCCEITDHLTSELVNDLVASCPNARNWVVFGKPAFDAVCEGKALQSGWIKDKRLRKQTCRLAHGLRQRINWTNEEERIDLCRTYSKCAADALGVVYIEPTEAQMKEIMPIAIHNLKMDPASARAYATDVLSNKLSKEELNELLDVVLDDTSTSLRKSRVAHIFRSVQRAHANDQEAEHWYCTSCHDVLMGSYGMKHSKCKKKPRGLCRLSKQSGKFELRVFRGYCEECSTTGILNNSHECSGQVNAKGKLGKNCLLTERHPTRKFSLEVYNRGKVHILCRKENIDTGKIVEEYTLFSNAAKDAYGEVKEEREYPGWAHGKKGGLHCLSLFNKAMSKELKGQHPYNQDGTVDIGRFRYSGIPIYQV